MARRTTDGVLLVDRELRGLLGGAVLAARPPRADQVQPASLDLRLAGDARALRASFLPGGVPLEQRLAELEIGRRTLDDSGIVLERGSLHLIRLEEELALPADLRATFNPRSSIGRCDVFVRVVVPGHARFDETPAGYRGPLWLEVAPLSFDVRVARGDALCQMRLERGRAVLAPAELAAQHAALPLVHLERAPVPGSEVRWHPEGGIELALGLAGRDPAGWRARHGVRTELALGREKSRAAAEFFEPVHAPQGRTILAPGDFTLFASRERLQLPPHLAADVVPVDVGIGELRNNYAGFFDPGFGRGARPDGRPGTPAVLEVRARDVPFQVEDGQALFRLRFFRLSGLPERSYGEGRSGASYGDQDLALARVFR